MQKETEGNDTVCMSNVNKKSKNFIFYSFFNLEKLGEPIYFHLKKLTPTQSTERRRVFYQKIQLCKR